MARNRRAEQEAAEAALPRSEALVSRDEPALRQLTHPDLLWTTYRGQVLNYEAYIAGKVRDNLAWRAQRLDEVKVAVAGDAAVLTARVTDEVHQGGRGQSFILRLTQAWVSPAAGWRCLARHASAGATTGNGADRYGSGGGLA